MKKISNFIHTTSFKLISLILICYILVFIIFFSTLKHYAGTHEMNENFSEELQNNVYLFHSIKSELRTYELRHLELLKKADKDEAYNVKVQITKTQKKLNHYFRNLQQLPTDTFTESKLKTLSLLYKKLKKTSKKRLNEEQFIFGEKQRQVNRIIDVIDEVNEYSNKKLQTEYKRLKIKNEKIKQRILISFIAFIFILPLVVFVFYFRISKPVELIHKNLRYLTRGEIPKYKIDETSNEIGAIAKCINKLTDNFDNTTYILKELSKNRFDAEIKLRSPGDKIYGAINKLKKSILLLNRELDVKRDSENERDWVNVGLAKFSNILRENNTDLNELFEIILQELIKYINAVQGAVYTVEEDKEEEVKYLIMNTSYAYDTKKITDKKFLYNEGLVGRCAIERKTVYLTDIPQDFIEVKSGMGQSKPVSILLFPLIYNKIDYGVIELAFFKNLELFEREFAEKLGELIASSIFNVKTNMRTADLLAQAQRHAQEMQLQEKIMRRQLSELKETQKEADRKEEASQGFVAAVNHTVIRADFDLEGHLMYANTKFYEVMGYSSREAEGKHYSLFIDNEDKEEFDNAWERISQGGKHFEDDVRYKTKNGYAYLFVTYTIVRDAYANLDKVLFLAIDTGERISKENEMQKLITAYEQTSIKAEFALDGLLLNCSQKFLQVTGCQLDELEGKNVPLYLKKQKIVDFEIIWQNAKSGIEFNDVLTFTNKKNKVTLADAAIFPVEDVNRNITKIQMIACCFDFNSKEKFAIDF